MLVPTWPRYRKVDLNQKIPETLKLNGPATTFLDALFGPHYPSAGIGENILLPYLPEFYAAVEDFVVLTEAGSSEVLQADTAIDHLLDDQFVMTASLNAIRRREKMLGIQADPTTETLEFRRKRLINRYSTKPPFTRRYLQEQLDALIGAGMTIVSVDVQNFVLYVTTNVENATVFREAIRTVETVKPANMEYQQSTSLRSTIGLGEHITKQDITWNYALGTWQLGAQPFSTLGSEEVIK